MFHHVVVFSWQDGTTQQQVAAVAAELAKLPDEIPSIRRYEFFAVAAAFEDAAGYLAYRDHPAHRKLIENYLNPIVASRSRVQFEV